jgi:hypothetical protein
MIVWVSQRHRHVFVLYLSDFLGVKWSEAVAADATPHPTLHISAFERQPIAVAAVAVGCTRYIVPMYLN